MGNVKEESVLDIWRGENFSHSRRLLLAGDRDSLDICNKCDFYGTQTLYSDIGKILYVFSQ